MAAVVERNQKEQMKKKIERAGTPAVAVQRVVRPTEGKGYAWIMRVGKEWGICHWAEATRDQLLRGGKPSPEAKAIRVRLVSV